MKYESYINRKIHKNNFRPKIPNYKDKNKKVIKKAPVNKKVREKTYTAWETRWAAIEARWDKRDRLLEGKPYWAYYRRFKTFQDRRFASIKEYKLYIRGKRRHLPEPWGTEVDVHREMSWKARTKVKRQWLVNKK
jgi:hypothetical protein